MDADAREVMLVEEELALATRVRSALEGSGYTVPSIEVEADAALAAAEKHPPALAIVAVKLRRGCGVDLGAALGARQIPVLYLSDHADNETLRRMGATRPAGLVVKPFTHEQLLGSVHLALHRPRASADPWHAALERISHVLLELGLVEPGAGRKAPARSMPRLRELSTREWEVLRELLDHQRVPAIARRLHISPATVRNHLKAIYAKLGVHSQQELLHKVLHSE